MRSAPAQASSERITRILRSTHLGVRLCLRGRCASDSRSPTAEPPRAFPPNAPPRSLHQRKLFPCPNDFLPAAERLSAVLASTRQVRAIPAPASPSAAWRYWSSTRSFAFL